MFLPCLPAARVTFLFAVNIQVEVLLASFLLFRIVLVTNLMFLGSTLSIVHDDDLGWA